jgi:hypothetical protein
MTVTLRRQSVAGAAFSSSPSSITLMTCYGVVAVAVLGCMMPWVITYRALRTSRTHFAQVVLKSHATGGLVALSAMGLSWALSGNFMPAVPGVQLPGGCEVARGIGVWLFISTLIGMLFPRSPKGETK